MSHVTTGTGRRSRRSVDSAVVPDAPPRKRFAPIYLLALLLLSFVAWAPLLYPGFFQLHTGFQPLFNLADLTASPEFLRWTPPTAPAAGPLHGEGPLAYWLAWATQPLLGGIGALKAVLALSMLLGGLGMFWWTRRTASADADSEREAAARAGLLAAVVFMLWPPLLVNTFVVGGFGTALFLGLLSWALGAVAWSKARPGGDSGRAARTLLSRLVVPFLAAALLTLAQPALGLAALPLLLIWALWPPAGWPARLTTAAATAAGTATVWLLRSGAAAAADIDRFLQLSIHPYQLFSPVWGFGVNKADWKDDISLQVGVVALALAILTVAFSFSGRQRTAEAGTPARPATRAAVLCAAVSSLALALLATTLARPLWQLTPQVSGLLDSPWQLLLLAGPPLALLAGLLVHVERRLAALPVWSGIVALVLLGSYSYLAPRTTPVQPDLAVAAQFADQATLLRADARPLTSSLPLSLEKGQAEGEILAGNTLTVTLAWQPLRTPDFDYNVFIHALDGQGNRIAQWDGQPLRGDQEAPMTGWQVGDVVSGDYVVRTEQGQPVADIRTLWIGLYNWQTGQRLVVDGDDKATVTLAGPAAAGVSQ